MKFKVKLADGQLLKIEKSFWTGRMKLTLGQALIGMTTSFFPKEPFKVTFKDGSEHELLVKNHWLDPAPQVFVDAVEIESALRLKKWEVAIVCLPLVLIVAFAGGAVPALVAISAVYLNFFLAREKSMPVPVRWAVIGIVPVLSFFLLFGFSVWLHSKFDKSDKTGKEAGSAALDSAGREIWVPGPDGRMQRIPAPQPAQTYPQAPSRPIEPSFSSQSRPAASVEAELNRGPE